MRLKARWIEASRTLELYSKIKGDEGKEATITTKEQWQLVDSGKALKIIRTRETPQGTQRFKLHFDRQP